MASSTVTFKIWEMLVFIVGSVPQVCKTSHFKNPPGPWRLPIIGNLLTIMHDPHLALTSLKQKYGNVMQIHIGTVPVVVLSGFETIYQALVVQGDDFKARPDFYSFRFIGNGKSLTFGKDCGDVWYERKRMAQRALKSFSTSSNPMSLSSCYLETYVTREAELLIDKFIDLMKTAGHFDPYRYIMLSVTNVICAVCFGRTYDYNDKELTELLELNSEFGKVTGSGYPADFIPILRFLPSRTFTNFKNLIFRFTKFIQLIIHDHNQNHEMVIQSEYKHKALSNDDITSIVLDIFGAGFDTVSKALSWSLMYLVSNPTIQQKIHAELDAVVGQNRLPKFSDRAQLPYMNAFILEMLRHSSFVPFTIPHSTTRDTNLYGFDIPKGRCVFINQWQVNHDPDLWRDPFIFRPERFITTCGKIDRNLSDKVILFGMGQRKCIGETIGRLEIFLFLAILLQKLEFSVSADVTVDMTPIYGLTMKHRRCDHFKVCARV
uniref:Cytochrome P450 1A n=1 Tax=Sciurus vulgaris TaxID=55149 RepID=A0A8D2CY40_SCIVU